MSCKRPDIAANARRLPDDRSISTVEGAELLDEPMKVVRTLLNDLAQAGFVRAEGRTRARRYHPVD